MAATLVQMPAAWEKPLSKVKTPYELVISVLKVLQIPAAQIPSEKIYGSLKAMDHVPFNAPSPAGWGDTADDWMSGNSLMTRIEWCHALSQLVGSGVDASALAQDVLNGVITPTTLSSISRAPLGCGWPRSFVCVTRVSETLGELLWMDVTITRKLYF